MLEKQGNPLTFLAHFIASKVSATGLTVTYDLWEVQQDGTAAEIVTAGSATEVGDGLYRAILPAVNVDANAEYICIFKTANTSVDQQHLAAVYSVGRAGVANLDATVSSRASQTSVNTIDDLIDTEVAEILADIAALSGTTLTVVNVVNGNTITLYVADTWEFTLTGLGTLTDYEVVTFTAKRNANDTDNDAVLYVRSDTGLVRLNQAAATAGDGSLTIGSGQITVVVAMSATSGVTMMGGFKWWIKGLDTSATPDEGTTIATGIFEIKAAGLRAIV